MVELLSIKVTFAYSVSVACYLMTHHPVSYHRIAYHLFLLPAPTLCIYSLVFFIDQSTHEFYPSTTSGPTDTLISESIAVVLFYRKCEISIGGKLCCG